jgi:hypothetical protein
MTAYGLTDQVSITNFPVTQSIFVGNVVPVQSQGVTTVTGSVGVSGITFPEAVSVTGTVYVTQTGSFHVDIDNLPVTQSVFVGNTVPVQIENQVTITTTGSFVVYAPPTNPVWVTGSVFVGNQSGGAVTQGAGSSTNPWWITSTGSLAVYIENLPVTQSVFIGNVVPVQIQGMPTFTVGNSVLNVSMSNSPLVGVSGSITATLSASSVSVSNFLSPKVFLSVTPFRCNHRV